MARVRNSYRPALESLEDRRVPATLLTGFTQSVVAGGLNQPTAFAIAPDGRIFIAEQTGALRVVSFGQLRANPVLTLNVDSQGERGLLGVAVDPNYATNHFIYLYHTVPGATANDASHNQVSRFTLNGDAAVANSETDLLDLDALGTKNHNGGAIHFGTDGKLYVAVGDNANPNIDPRAIDSRFGKLLRINADGTIPSDNPFFITAAGVNRAIYATGLRNPFTFAVQRGLGKIFVNDVGQATWEEINVVTPGANFGWRDSEGPTTNPNYTSPLYAYLHGGGAFEGAAITGGAFYNPAVNQFPREYGGTYFFQDLVGGWIHNVNPRTKVVTRFALGLAASVDLQVSTSGYLYNLSRGNGTNTGTLLGISFKPVDLAANSLTAPATARANVAFTVSRTYSIAGSAFLSNFNVRYVASQDATLGNSDDVFLVNETVAAASAKTLGSHAGTSPAVRVPRAGKWYVFAVLDSAAAIPETNEANNVLRSPMQVTVS